MKNKEFWKSVIQLAISVFTAALTAISTTSCMGTVRYISKKGIFLEKYFEKPGTRPYLYVKIEKPLPSR